MTLGGAADTDAILAFVQHVLTPTLLPGQVVALGNLNVHKATRVRALIEAVCCTLSLPLYSPDFSREIREGADYLFGDSGARSQLLHRRLQRKHEQIEFRESP